MHGIHSSISPSIAILLMSLPAVGFGNEAKTASADGPSSVAAQVSFVNDVLPVLSKAGCNQGRCHASATGKGGLHLSLRGYAPEQDYYALTHHLFDRRINSAAPDLSLILAKPSQAVPHQGGEALPKESVGYAILREWIQRGSPPPNPNDPQVVELTVTPARVTLKVGTKIELRVKARFADGHERDVTTWARYDTNSGAIITVDESGAALARGSGQAAVSAAYQNLVAAVDVTVPFATSEETRNYSSLPRTNYIDDLVIDKWEELRLWPSAPVDDATFLRRVYLNVAGRPPRPDEVRRYTDSESPNKRNKLIDDLLASPDFVDMWTQKWGDVFRISREWLGEKAMWSFHEFLHDRFERNVRWDVVARELIAASGDSTQSGAVNFYRTQRVFNDVTLWPLVAAETTSQVFLGVQITCARCHNHPFEKWTQDDYYGMASFFAQVGEKGKLQGKSLHIIHDRNTRKIPHPRRGKALPPKPLGMPRVPADGPTRRHDLARWVTSRNNPYFARATANRVWRHFMSSGIVEPVDDFRASNPPTNRNLLEALAQDFMDHDYDLRHLMRTILRSRVYQLSASATEHNRSDHRFYSHYRPRRMTAEQILDALGDLTGKRQRFNGFPVGFRAQQLPDTQVASSFLDSFGRPLRRLASCECERIQEPNLVQALELMNSEMLHDMVTADEALIQRLIADPKVGGEDITDAQLIDEIYLRALGRASRFAEKKALLAEWRQTAADTSDDPTQTRREFFEDLLWAIINSKEFLFSF